MTDCCPICGGSFEPWMTMPIDPKKETPTRYGALFRCSGCSLGMVLPRPAADEIGEFYALQNYYTHDQSHFADRGPVSFADRLRFHLAWRADRSQDLTPEWLHRGLDEHASDICDVGCGTGKLALELQKLGHRVVGLELDARAAQVARGNGIEVHEGPIDRLPDAIAGRQFDVVIMSHVLEHVSNPVEAVRTVFNMLRPGGRFVCAVPNNASAGLAWTGIAWEPLDVPRHLNFFVPENLVAIAERAGFHSPRLFFNGYCRQFSNEWINTERRIYDAIKRQGNGAADGYRQNSRWRAWGLLARTAFAGDATKYDAVGVVAVRP